MLGMFNNQGLEYSIFYTKRLPQDIQMREFSAIMVFIVQILLRTSTLVAQVWSFALQEKSRHVVF